MRVVTAWPFSRFDSAFIWHGSMEGIGDASAQLVNKNFRNQNQTDNTRSARGQYEQPNHFRSRSVPGNAETNESRAETCQQRPNEGYWFHHVRDGGN